ncbi:MAG: protein kinase, partial [Candidatus Omnitrophica bacterium]|nr:protein kinase [Candidatus Omnitrophota bacterium]
IQNNRQLRDELNSLENKLSEKQSQLEAASENLSSIREKKKSLLAPTTDLTGELLEKVFGMAGREDAGDPAMPLPNAFRTLHDTAEALLGRHVTAGITQLPARSAYGITHDRAEALWQRLKMAPAEGETNQHRLVRTTIRDSLRAIYRKAERSESRLWGKTERAENAQEARVASLRKLISGMKNRMRAVMKELGMEVPADEQRTVSAVEESLAAQEEGARTARAANGSIKVELEVIRQYIGREQNELADISEAIKDLLQETGVLETVRRDTGRGEDPIPYALELLDETQISRLRELNSGRKKILADIHKARDEYGRLQAELAENARTAERAEARAEQIRQRIASLKGGAVVGEAAGTARRTEAGIFADLLTTRAESASAAEVDKLLDNALWEDIFPAASRSDDGLVSIGPNSYRVRPDAVIKRDAAGVSFMAEVIGGAVDGRRVVVKMPARNAGKRSRALLMQELVKMRVASGNGMRDVVDAGMITSADGVRSPVIVLGSPGLESLEALWASERGMTPGNRSAAARAVLEALSSLHSRNVIHRGLRPENLLYDGDAGRALLEGLELGLYSPGGGDIASRPQVGAKNFLPRRAIVEGMYGVDTDLFALGVTLYQMGHRGKLPFVGWESFLRTEGYNFKTVQAADGRTRRILTRPDGRDATSLEELMLAREWAEARERQISEKVRAIREDGETDVSRKLAA